ncbi:MAG: aminopeptidase [Gaiellaceae bacterium]|jgi:aminopeptidase|nr:aminopeptidase [Gaiellaceae bacterium]
MATGSSDTRIGEYARLLVDRSIGARPGWQVLVTGGPLARPLLEAISTRLGELGALPLQRIGFHGSLPFDLAWAEAAPELARELAPLDRHVLDEVDAAIFVLAPERPEPLGHVSPEARAALSAQASAFRARGRALEIPSVLCDYPVPAFAELAGLEPAEFEEVLYAACLRDWDAEGARMHAVKERLDAGETIRIVGADTDLTFAIAGREAMVDDGHLNMPGGEVFLCPLEDSATGTIRFSEFPQVAATGIVRDARLELRDGVVVDASAAEGEHLLFHALDRDEGARRIGELGIGCNDALSRPLNNLLFDEKIAGTVHVAIGSGFSFLGGQNQSVVHWDLIKDLRNGGRLELDGEPIQENGVFKA